MRHHNLDVPSAIKSAKSLRPIIDPIGMYVALLLSMSNCNMMMRVL
jgi:hypothetical protein